MPQALLPFIMNTMIAVMLAASFLLIAYLNPKARAARWIGLSFLFGAMEPVSNMAVVFGADAQTMRIVATACFLTGLAILSPALSLFHGSSPMWAAAFCLIAAGMAYRIATLDTPRDYLWYQVGFQLCFALPAALCAFTVWRHARATALNRVLLWLLAITSLHFLLKPLVAMRWNTGANEAEFASTTYAIVSQVSSGLLLLGIGLFILISVLQTVVQTNHAEARHDHLTGLPNRRALQEVFDALVQATPKRPGRDFLAIFDLDHFKRINDNCGHDKGDQVLREIAACLDRNRPASAHLARIGGEEFIFLLADQSMEGAASVCETLRLAVRQLALPDVDRLTVSIGLATIRADDSLAENMRRADQALYAAKNGGRDRCEFAWPETKLRLSLVSRSS